MIDLILWIDGLTFNELLMMYGVFWLCVVIAVNTFVKIVDALW